jgi:hypothetical protein
MTFVWKGVHFQWTESWSSLELKTTVSAFGAGIFIEEFSGLGSSDP